MNIAVRFGGTLLATLVLAPPSTASDAERKHPEQPMLWKIEGKGIRVPSYLFGTIHLSDPRATTLHPLAQKAFEEATVVYTELEQFDPKADPKKQSEANEGFIRGDDKSLAEIAGQDLVEQLDVELKHLKTGYHAEALRRNKLWALALELPMIAEKRRKKRVFLHSILNAYLKADHDALGSFLTEKRFMGVPIDPDTGRKVAKALLDDRNRKMAAAIEKALKDNARETFFFAVGASHCVGKNSVVQFLGEAGYKVTQVRSPD